MAAARSFLCFLTLVIYCSLVRAAPWIVTDYWEEEHITSYLYDYYYSSNVAPYVTTVNQEVRPTGTSLPEAVSTYTNVGTGYYASDVTVVNKLYTATIGTTAYDLAYGDTYSAYETTIYVVNFTYTAPTGCSTQWTTTTSATVTPPSSIEALLPRTATSTSFSVDKTSSPFSPTTYTYVYVWVEPTQIPSTSLACLSDESRPTDLYSGSKCQYTGSDNCGYYYGGYDGSDEAWYNDSSWMGISPLAIILICILGWVGLFFILGVIEAWVRFQRLMTGWQTRRGFPLFWAFMLLPVSLFCLCCFRKGYRSRNAGDAAFLQQKWRDMSAWTKFKLFIIWGFRFKYPDVLGPAPMRVKQSKRPGKDAGPPLLNPSPSQTAMHGPPMAAGARGPEMAQESNTAQHLAQAPLVPGAAGALPGQEEGRQEENVSRGGVVSRDGATSHDGSISRDRPVSQGEEIGRAH
ncbi:uncharacterized protein N7443_007428 [Penicillium atrosanguineum]|uniref:uncharacterized protein n=1 Tax=Penicillium atrosanguineum TaxID=1132637 RepID=UPI002391381B|nr:uncharacterized protein N7443_007428 [Penicillium atrosanguineum]KAJ5118496.1 hypothetical protein N7526_010133 [Penicillium atrosanguineum]KAJ5296535.1 hypothetical protein N7443_007428 [Penicillium atrosanguineum]